MIPQSEYKQRRQDLLSQLLPDSVVFIPSNQEVLRNGFDNVYSFRQRSDFWYLTGFEEPNAVLVLTSNGDKQSSVLFCQPKNPAEEVWTGYRLGQDGAREILGMDQAFVIDQFDEMLPSLLQGSRHVYYPIARDLEFDQKLLVAYREIRKRVRKGVPSPEQLLNVETPLHFMRLMKSDAELEEMRYANKISSQAHIELMKACRPGMAEYELEAIFKGYCCKYGLQEMAYTPIVAAGKNACVLHYIENNSVINDGDMMLVDAGGEYQCYSSDITRCYPANGKFTGEQRALYEVVLRAQEMLIDHIKPGTTWMDMQNMTIRSLTEGMVDIGMLKGKVDDLIADKTYFNHYMHLFGHWLGLDTHDAGKYCDEDNWYVLKPGMVTTVEPGLYVAAGSKVDERWWNIGIRIEDDVVVTEDGRENLTTVPKSVDEIEALMRS